MRIIQHDLSSSLDTVKLYPISDLHLGDGNTDLKMFRALVNTIKDTDNFYTVLVGDLINNAVVGSVSNSYEDTLTPHQQKRQLIEELKPIKDKILAVVPGNHEYRSRKTTDTHIIYDICDSLNILDRYCDDEAVVKLSFGKRNINNRRQCYSLYLTHGSGGGKRPGSAINNIEMAALSVNADVFIFGHYHKKIAYKNQYRNIDLNNNIITERERLFIVSSHWAEFFGGYAARGMFVPSAKGSVPITLYAKEKYFEATI